MLCEDPTVQHLPVTDTAVGIDVGLNHLLTHVTGEEIANPRHERRGGRKAREYLSDLDERWGPHRKAKLHPRLRPAIG